MSVELAQAYLQIIPSMRGFKSTLTSQIGGQASAAGGQAGSQFGDRFKSSVGSVVKSGLFGIAAGAGYQVLQGVEGAFGAAGKAIFGFNSTLQQSTIGFTTMLGSAQKAQSFVGQLQDFAKKTPFDFEGLTQNANQMLGMGIAAKDIIPDLTALGDSVASTGGNADTLNNTILAFSQISAKGTVDMGNLNQLLEGGVPNALKILAAGFHVTTGEMVKMISTGKVQSPQALAILTKGLEQGTKSTAALGGMMDKQSVTMQGALSNIQDASTQLLAKAFKPLFNEATVGANGLANLLGSPKMTVWATQIAATTQHVIDRFKSFPSIAKDFAAGFALKPGDLAGLNAPLEGVMKTGAQVRTVFGGLGSVFKIVSPLGAILTKVFTDMGPALSTAAATLGRSFLTLVPSVEKVLAAILPLAPKLAQIIVALAPLVPPLADALVFLVNNAVVPLVNQLNLILSPLAEFQSGVKAATVVTEAMSGKFGVAAQVAYSWANTVAGSIRTAVGIISSVVTFVGQAVANIRGFFGAVGSVFAGVVARVSSAWAAISGVVSRGVAFVRSVIQTGFLIIFGLFVIAWGRIAAVVGPPLARIVSAVSGGLNRVRSVVSAVLNAVHGVFTSVWNAVSGFVSGVLGRIVSVVSGGMARTRGAVVGPLNALHGTWNAIWGAVAGTVSAIWSRIAGIVSSGVGRVVSFVGGIRSRVLGAIGNLGSALYSVGQDLIRGLINGATSMIGNLVGTVSNIAGNAISAAKNALGIHSPSTITHEMGIYFGQGLANGITSSRPVVSKAVGTLATATNMQTSAQVRVNTASVGAAASAGGAASARPIVMDGNLFGVLQQLANGEARIVLNLDQHHRKVASAAGAR